MLRGLGHSVLDGVRRSSAMTIASGVTTSAGNSPAEPFCSRRFRSPVPESGQLLGRPTSSKSASSPLAATAFREPPRSRPPGERLRQAQLRPAGSSIRRACGRRSAATVWVVLDSMVDLADRRILGQQRLLLRRRSVTSRTSTSAPRYRTPLCGGMLRNVTVTSSFLNLSRSW